jgi:hypothetical protein
MLVFDRGGEVLTIHMASEFDKEGVVHTISPSKTGGGGKEEGQKIPADDGSGENRKGDQDIAKIIIYQWLVVAAMSRTTDTMRKA